MNRGAFQPAVGTHLRLYNQPLVWSEESKYLGILFDRRISFKQHIENKIATAKKKLHMLGKVFRDTWGPSPTASKWAYTGIVRPALAYGSIIWWDKVQTDDMQKKLKKLQRLALLMIAPVRKSTPTAALELLYDIKPLHLFLKEQALKSALRIGITNPNWLYKDTKGHQHLLMESLPNELKNCKIDNVKTTMIWEKNYDVQIGKGDDISNRRDWTCYTDGSKSGLRSGSGSVILHLNKVHTNLSYSVGSAEVFQAEISAVLGSAKILLDYRVQNCGVDFLVDSQAALMALLNPTTTSDLVRETKRVLNELGSSNNLVMHWIRAHRGWVYNEMADHNANEGAKAVALPENIPTPSRCSRYTIIEDMIKREWVDLWEKEPCR